MVPGPRGADDWHMDTPQVQNSPSSRSRRPREAGSITAGAIAWTVTLSLVLLIGVLQAIGGAELLEDPEAPLATSEPADTPRPGAMLEVMGKYAVFAARFADSKDAPSTPATPQPDDEETEAPTDDESPDAPDDDVAPARTPARTPAAAGSIGSQVVAPLNAMATNGYDELRIAMIAGEAIDAPAALEMIDAVAGEEDLPEPLRADIETLRTIYIDGPDAVDDESRGALVERHDWFGRLALAFGKGKDDPDRAGVITAANRVGTIVVTFFVVVAILGLTGFVLFFVAIFLGATGTLKLGYRRPGGVGSVGIETFTIFLLSFLAIQVVASALIGAFGEAAEPAAQWLVWLLLVVPLWPLVGGVSIVEMRESLGWTRGKGVLREIGAGIVGYLAGAPIVAAGIGLVLLFGLVAEAISGAEGPPPSHPLPEELSGAGPLMAIQLVLLATAWAPVVEESIFRGALYNHLRGALHPILAGLISAFLFAAIHPQGVIAIPALMSLGFVFAMLREWRGSIIALNNGMVVAMLLFLFTG